MLKIYGADLSAPANKVRFVANYLNLEFEYFKISIRDGEHRKEEFLKINPVGKVPAIDDDGLRVFESGAICRYLAAKHGSDVYPADLKEKAVVDAWSDFISIHIHGAMGRVLFNRVFYQFAKTAKDERSLSDGLGFLDRFLPVAESQLGKNSYVAGQKLSLADFTLLSALDPAEIAEVDISSYKNIVKWRGELKKQEFYTKTYREYGEILKERLKK